VQTVILRGRPEELGAWQGAIRSYAPRRMVFAIPDSESDLPAGLATKAARVAPVAYVCEGTHCEAPVDSLAALVARLGPARSG
jgi:hypothetical protein